MTRILTQMFALAPAIKTFNIQQALTASDRGERLAGYVYLYTNPNVDDLAPLVDSVARIKDEGFGQYWGIQAIGKVLASVEPGRIEPQILGRLRDFLVELPPTTDRHYELKRILSPSVTRRIASHRGAIGGMRSP